MRFLWPELLWLLLIVPVLIAGYIYALHRRRKSAIRYASLMLVRDALGPRQGLRRHLPPALFLVGLTFPKKRNCAVMANGSAGMKTIVFSLVS